MVIHQDNRQCHRNNKVHHQHNKSIETEDQLEDQLEVLWEDQWGVLWEAPEFHHNNNLKLSYTDIKPDVGESRQQINLQWQIFQF